MISKERLFVRRDNYEHVMNSFLRGGDYDAKVGKVTLCRPEMRRCQSFTISPDRLGALPRSHDRWLSSLVD